MFDPFNAGFEWGDDGMIALNKRFSFQSRVKLSFETDSKNTGKETSTIGYSERINEKGQQFEEQHCK